MIKKYGNNPVIQNMGICDPHLHAFKDRVYMYCSHDVDRKQKGYHMKDWCICSSKDMVQWEIEIRQAGGYLSWPDGQLLGDRRR